MTSTGLRYSNFLTIFGSILSCKEICRNKKKQQHQGYIIYVTVSEKTSPLSQNKISGIIVRVYRVRQYSHFELQDVKILDRMAEL